MMDEDWERAGRELGKDELEKDELEKDGLEKG
jgi:hypothetical protein